MKIVVLGGAGMQGQYAVRELIRQGNFSEIVVASRNIARVEEFVDGLNSPLVRAEQVDVMDKSSLYGLLEGAYMVANCTGPYYLLAKYVIDACLDLAINYVDLCDDIVVFKEFFTPAYLEEARKKDITMIMGLGVSPGVFPLHALYHANKMDRARDVSIYVAGSIFGILYGEPILDHMLENMLGDLEVIREGETYFEEPFQGLEEYYFEGLGSLPVSTLGHPEIFTLPRALKGLDNLVVKVGYREKDIYLSFVDLLKSGFASREALDVKGQEVVPADFLVAKLIKDARSMDMSSAGGKSHIIINVEGEKDQKSVSYRSTYIVSSPAMIGYPLAQAADWIATGKIQEKGLMVPEECIDPKPFLDEFVRRMHEGGEDLEIIEEYKEKGAFKKD